MAGEDRDNKRLLQYLERNFWDPVLKATPDGYSDSEKRLLKRVQQRTQEQRERYRQYASPSRIRQSFEEDLNSRQAQKTNSDLDKLGLPVQSDVADGLFRLADRILSTSGSEGGRRAARTSRAGLKPKLRSREESKRKLQKAGRREDKSAARTMAKAPRKWAQDEASEIRASRTSVKKGSAAAGAKKTVKKAAKTPGRRAARKN